MTDLIERLRKVDPKAPYSAVLLEAARELEGKELRLREVMSQRDEVIKEAGQAGIENNSREQALIAREQRCERREEDLKRDTVVNKLRSELEQLRTQVALAAVAPPGMDLHAVARVRIAAVELAALWKDNLALFNPITGQLTERSIRFEARDWAHFVNNMRTLGEASANLLVFPEPPNGVRPDDVGTDASGPYRSGGFGLGGLGNYDDEEAHSRTAARLAARIRRAATPTAAPTLWERVCQWWKS